MKKILISCLLMIVPSLVFAQAGNSKVSRPYSIVNAHVEILSVPDDFEFGFLKVYRLGDRRDNNCDECGTKIKFSRDLDVIVAKQDFGRPNHKLLELSGQKATVYVGGDGLVSRLEIKELVTPPGRR